MAAVAKTPGGGTGTAGVRAAPRPMWARPPQRPAAPAPEPVPSPEDLAADDLAAEVAACLSEDCLSEEIAEAVAEEAEDLGFLRSPAAEAEPPAAPVAAPEEADAGVHDHARVPYVYHGDARLLHRGDTSSTGMTVKLNLCEVTEEDTHPFRAMRWGKDGQRLHVVFNAYGEDGEFRGVYAGEAVLAWWATDCAHGAMIRLKLDDGPDGAGEHPFKPMRAGQRDGDRVMMTAWAVADDETVQAPDAVRARRPFHTLKPTAQAALLVGDQRFVRWLERRLDDLIPPEGRPDFPVPDGADGSRVFAEAVIRSWCGVASRRVLNEDSEAGERARDRWTRLLASYEDDRRGGVVLVRG